MVKHVQKSLKSVDTHQGKHTRQPTFNTLTHLTHKLGLWNRNPKFRLRHLKAFGSSSNPPKLHRPRLHTPGRQWQYLLSACGQAWSLGRLSRENESFAEKVQRRLSWFNWTFSNDRSCSI